jgi:saposin
MMRFTVLACLCAVVSLSLANVADNRTPKDHVAHSNAITFNDRLSAADVCSECKVVVQEVDQMLHSAEKLEEFKLALKMLCNYLGGDEKEECKTIIDNIDVIIHKVEPYLNDPEMLCKEIGFCGEDSHDVPRLMRMSLVHANAFLTRSRNDVMCDECQFVMNEVKNIVAEKDTQDEAKEVLESACNSILSGSSATECVNIIDQYLPLLWEEVVALLDDTHGLCVDLSLCASITARKNKPMSLVRLLPALRTVNHHHDHNQIEDNTVVNDEDDLFMF